MLRSACRWGGGVLSQEGGLDRFGKKQWNKLLAIAIEQTAHTFNWDHLYIGGGNTKKITIALPKNAKIVSNKTGILGGVALWKDE